MDGGAVKVDRVKHAHFLPGGPVIFAGGLHAIHDSIFQCVVGKRRNGEGGE